MPGLIGNLLAGGAKGAANARMGELAREQEFDMRKALLDASFERDVLLKKMGYEIENERENQKAQKRAEYFSDVEEAGEGGETTKRSATLQDATERAFKSGDFESGEGLLKLAPKKDAPKGYESIKLDDGSVLSFNKDSGKAELAFEGVEGSVALPKNETEIIWRAANGDKTAIKAASMIVEQKRKVASAGRAPTKETDGEMAFRDWKKKPENQGKGYDDFLKEKSSWGKTDGLDVQTVTEKPVLDPMGRTVMGKDGKPVMTKSTTKKEKIKREGFNLDDYFDQ